MEPIIGILGVCLFITGLWKAKHLRVLSKLIKTRPSATQQLELDTDDGELGDVPDNLASSSTKEGPWAALAPRADMRQGVTSIVGLVFGSLFIIVGLYFGESIDMSQPSSPPSTPPPRMPLPSPTPPASPPPPPPTPRPPQVGPIPLILDSDFSFDVDDVGALCVAHALADLGEAEIIGVIFDSGYPLGVAAIDAVNHYYGRGHIPLGAYKGVFGRDVGGLYVPTIAREHAMRFPNGVHNSSMVPDAAHAYRQILIGADDATVVIAAVGFMTGLRDLLASPPDEISPLDGVSLVRQKVRKVVFRGGWYAPLHPNGHQTFNWDCGGAGAGWSPYSLEGCRGATQFVLATMPEEVQMVFSDIGDEIYHAGTLIRGVADGCAAGTADSPCRQAYRLHS